MHIYPGKSSSSHSSLASIISISGPKSTLPMLKEPGTWNTVKSFPQEFNHKLSWRDFIWMQCFFHTKIYSGHRSISWVPCDSSSINLNPKVSPYQRNFSVLRINGKIILIRLLIRGWSGVHFDVKIIPFCSPLNCLFELLWVFSVWRLEEIQ